MDLGLRGRVALITGAGQGVGRAIAHTLAAEGARVVVNDIVVERAKAVEHEIADAGGEAWSYGCSVTDRNGVMAMVSEIQARWGAVDVLVNNAGVLPERRAGEIGIPNFIGSDPGHWPKFVDLNLFGVLNCVDAVGAGMLERRTGKIVTIVSDAGRVGEPRLAVYSAAKAAAIGFTKALAKEVGRYRVNVNCVSLSAVAHESPRCHAGDQRNAEQGAASIPDRAGARAPHPAAGCSQRGGLSRLRMCRVHHRSDIVRQWRLRDALGEVCQEWRESCGYTGRADRRN
jgi:2-hydroxycyclohexanecarboxyl-CoA dehydrogenase